MLRRVTLGLAVALAHADSCGSNGTKCPVAWSPNGFGCCVGAGMTCCLSDADPHNLWPPRNTYCCPAAHTCDAATYNKSSGTGGCLPAAPPPRNHPPIPVHGACKAGVGSLPMRTDIANAFVLGDSVSIGYTPFLSLFMRSELSIQHTPWDETDGGAGATHEGLDCLDFWIRDLDHELLSPAPEMIIWNFGLHDQPHGEHTAAVNATYEGNLRTLSERMAAAYPHARQLFVLTTPNPSSAEMDLSVRKFNELAVQVMEERGGTTADLRAAARRPTTTATLRSTARTGPTRTLTPTATSIS